jgi:hypothetical protein
MLTTNATTGSSQSSAPICRTVLQYGTADTDPTTYTLYDCIPLGGNTRIQLQNLYSYSSSLSANPLIDPSYTFDGTTFVPIANLASSTSRSTQSSGSTTTPNSGPSTPGPVNIGGDDLPRPKKSNTGAIAGGVVGGLVAVGLLTGGVIWALMRKKEKARREAGAVNEVSHVTYTHDQK